MAVRNPLVDRALQAWTRGDLEAFELALAPDAELLWFEAGPWDCHSRADIIAQVRRRIDAGRPAFDVSIEDVDENTLVVSAAHSAPQEGLDDPETATKVTIAGGLIVRLQQYRTREEALAEAVADAAQGER